MSRPETDTPGSGFDSGAPFQRLGQLAPPSTPGRRAVGIFLAPGSSGRLTAFLIAGVPLVLCLIIGFESADSSPAIGANLGSAYGTNGSQGDGSGNGGSTGGYPSAYPTYTTEPAYGADGSASPTYGYGYPSSGDTTDTTTATASVTASPSATGPAAVVLAAYAAVNRQDYQTAYSLGLGGSGGATGDSSSYQQFAAGYADTSSVAVTIVSVTGDQVEVTLQANQTDGTQQDYAGTYTVSGGIITGSQIEETG